MRLLNWESAIFWLVFMGRFLKVKKKIGIIIVTNQKTYHLLKICIWWLLCVMVMTWLMKGLGFKPPPPLDWFLYLDLEWTVLGCCCQSTNSAVSLLQNESLEQLQFTCLCHNICDNMTFFGYSCSTVTSHSRICHRAFVFLMGGWLKYLCQKQKKFIVKKILKFLHLITFTLSHFGM